MEKTKAKSPAKVSSCTRLSARLQQAADKQRAEKEELVRNRMKLLDENSGGRIKKINSLNQDVESADHEEKKKQKDSGEILGSNEGKTENEVVIANSAGGGGGDGGGGGGGGGGEVVKSAFARAKETLRLFNKHYLYFIQEEEKRCAKEDTDEKASKKRKRKTKKGGKSSDEDEVEVAVDVKNKSKRPDLKAVTKIMELKAVMYPEKRIGDLPGINVGHQFYSRAEMVAIGLHSHWLNGIDFMGQSYKKNKQYRNHTFPLAIAIVLSGMYEDDNDNADEVVYTGQGGNDLLGNKRQIKNQVMERGNLALKNCVEQSVPIRVIRGHNCKSSYTRKVYTYDGLYNVVDYWAEEGISGFTVFKFRLKRLEGQPTLTTNQVQFINGRVPQSVSEIRGLVCEDISGGLEKYPIPATNLVDNPPVPPPAEYIYRKSLKVAANIKIPPAATGCSCRGSCLDPRTCACARRNGSDFPYVHKDGGRLIEAKEVVFECGPNCGCGPDCVNRTSQGEIRFKLEVFKTPKKGWAVRSWDFIPAGSPICEYIGVLRRTQDMDHAAENYYIFDIDCLQTMKGMDGRQKRIGKVSRDNMDGVDDSSSENAPEFCIEAGSTGNVARFINHSCEPNLFVQCVSSSNGDLKLARIVLFAADNIPPLQELSYDYGYVLDSVHGPDGKVKQMACFCGAPDCRKRLL